MAPCARPLPTSVARSRRSDRRAGGRGARPLEIDVAPAKAAQLGSAQAGEDRGEQQHPEAPGAGVERAYDRAHLGRRGDVDVGLELAGALGTARALSLAQGIDHVLRHQPAFLRIGEDGAERAADVTHHGRRAPVTEEPVFESAHQGHGQLREPERPEDGRDVQVGMLPISRDGRPFQPRALAAFDPQVGGFGDGDALAVGGM